MERVRKAFDAETFRAQGHALVDRLAEYLGRATRGEPMPVLPWTAPEAQLGRWPAEFPAGAGTSFDALVAAAIEQSNHLHHPRYAGHQVTSPLPSAALCDLVSSLLNNGAAVYEMGPVAVAAERALARFFAGALGLPGEADGVFTSGGSAGNLTALLAARQAKAGWDAWGQGAAGGPPLTFLVATDTHYSVARATKIMGLGDGGAWPVPIDERHRMRVDALGAAKRAAEAAGRRVIGVVASAGSTATGAFDPLAAIADFCAGAGLWLHVDGAHGAAAVLSEAQRPRLAGIERADSVVLDAHKMLLMPALITAVLFRDGRRGYQAFAQEASYLFDATPPETQWHNLASRTLECTKSLMALKLYVALALHGPAFFAEYIDGMFALARRFAARLAAAPDFELAVEPDCNIVCFRHTPAGVPAPALDALQSRLRQRLLESGHFYIVQTRLPRGLFLRVTLINPFTDDAHLAALLDTLRQEGTVLHFSDF
jgi:L-2,4-diaminobutyrate decarboxylase